MFNVSNSLLRYWETEFPVLKIKKNRKGDRQYMVKDIETIARIYTLVKERGFTIEGARKELKKKPEDSKPIPGRPELVKLKARLEKLKTEIRSLKDSLTENP